MIELPSDFHAKSQLWLVYHAYLLRATLCLKLEYSLRGHVSSLADPSLP